MDVRDKHLWRRVMKLAHPDSGTGDEEVFKFLMAVKASLGVEEEPHKEARPAWQAMPWATMVAKPGTKKR